MAFLKLGYPVSFCHLWILYSNGSFFFLGPGNKVKKLKINHENLISLFNTEEKFDGVFF